MTNFLTAISFLTKIPIPKKLIIDDKDLARSMAFFPIVGLLLGLILAAVNTALTPFISDRLVNLILVLLSILLTGALHLDGLADTVDGFCAKTKNKEEILNIMRDSRIGSMGVIALVVVILFKYEMLNTMPLQLKNMALVLMCSISRWGQVMAAYSSKYAREGEGTGGAFVGKVSRRAYYSAAALVFLISTITWFPKGLLILFLSSMLVLLAMKYINKKINGMTGDTIGAVSELTEVFILLGIYILGKV
jgi:adenosylcobinamide-GDP ribazoletransferase